MKLYAGIGPRSVSEGVCITVAGFGAVMASKGYKLRSGGARGCDSAFELGCDAAGGDKEIWLPKDGYKGRYADGSTVKALNADGYFAQTGKELRFDSDIVSRLFGRNHHIILGEDLYSPVELVLYWHSNDPTEGKGTNHALEIAKRSAIRAVNVCVPSERAAFLEELGVSMKELVSLGNAIRRK